MENVVVERELLGTLVRIIVPVVSFDESFVNKKIEEAFLEIKRVEKKYSRFLESNELHDLNMKLGIWVQVSDELFGLIKLGEDLKKLSAGSFNLCVKELLESWGYDKKYSFHVKGHEKGDFREGGVEMGEDNLVKLSAEIDLGALGKGYAVDRAADVLAEFDTFCINAGGDIFARGPSWEVFFENPLIEDEVIGKVSVDGFALACSNPNKRKWGNRHHLVDAQKMFPADEMLAVYTQAKTCILADASCTALFVMGFEAAKREIKNFPVEAMLISKTGAIFKSAGFLGELFEG